MSFFNEYPMYSPHERALLFTAFTYNGGDIEEQLINFVNYKKIKWICEKKTSKGTYQIVPGLLMEKGSMKIRTNSLEEIKKGDLIKLKHPSFKNQYFLVADDVEIEGIYCPKYRQTFQHLSLEVLMLKEINTKRSTDNA